jgi:thiol:disulfide interchange protein
VAVVIDFLLLLVASLAILAFALGQRNEASAPANPPAAAESAMNPGSAPTGGTTPGESQSPKQEIHWLSLEDALACHAETPGRPVLVFHTANDCGPCRRLSQNVFADPRVARLLNERFYAAITINEPGRVPRLDVYRSGSLPLRDVRPFFTADRFLHWLERLL